MADSECRGEATLAEVSPFLSSNQELKNLKSTGVSPSGRAQMEFAVVVVVVAALQ